MMLYAFILDNKERFRVTEILRRADDISPEFGGLLREVVKYRPVGFTVRMILEELGYTCKGAAWHGTVLKWNGVDYGKLTAQNGNWDIAITAEKLYPNARLAHTKQQLVNVIGERLPLVQDEMYYPDVRRILLWADSLVEAKPTKLRALNSCPSGRKAEDFLRAVAHALQIPVEIWEVQGE